MDTKYHVTPPTYCILQYRQCEHQLDDQVHISIFGGNWVGRLHGHDYSYLPDGAIAFQLFCKACNSGLVSDFNSFVAQQKKNLPSRCQSSSWQPAYLLILQPASEVKQSYGHFEIQQLSHQGYCNCSRNEPHDQLNKRKTTGPL